MTLDEVLIKISVMQPMVGARYADDDYCHFCDGCGYVRVYPGTMPLKVHGHFKSCLWVLAHQQLNTLPPDTRVEDYTLVDMREQYANPLEKKDE